MIPEEKRTNKPQHRKRKRTRDEIIRRRIAILAVVAVLMLAFAIWLKLWIREPDVDRPPAPTQDVSQGEEPAGNGRKKGVYTFLLLGKDTGGGGNTDTMMVASYDTVNQTVDVMNIYRDTMVNAPWDIKRINSVYAISGGGEEGIEALKGYLEDLLGFKPDYYITIEWDAVGELVDAIGGVEFDVPYEMHYWDPTQDLRIDQAKGYRTLYGEDAMQVIRWRQNNDGSGISVGDNGRVGIQQDFLRAVVKKCLNTVNLSTVSKYAQILMNNVTTDIPMGTVVWFGQQALSLDMANLQFHSLPAANINGAAWSRTYKNMQSYVLADGGAIVELVNARFNPYEKDILESDLDIMSVNPDGSLSSSRGEVADTKAAVPPVKPGKEPGPSSEPEPTDEPPEAPSEEPTEPPAEEPAPEQPGESEPPLELPVETEPPEPELPAPEPTDGEPEVTPEVLPAVPVPAA